MIGAIGRPRPVKGYSILLEAFSRIANDYPEARLLFVGDGPDQAALESQAISLGLENRATFLGDQVNIPSLLPVLDFLALPSLHEGLGNVALEAMAARLAVIGSRTGGIPEVVLDGETGLLVPPGDPAYLARALVKLIEDPLLRMRLGAAGRELVEQKYNLQASTARTMQLYDEVIVEKIR
jgi:glycosyltransferase involved in cell wall biosynthesis